MQGAGADEVAVLEEAAGREPKLAAKVGTILPRNTLMHDGTHIPKERAVNKEERKADSSGKKKTTTNNAVITINGNGVILGLSDYVPGSTHDLTLIRNSSPDLGLITWVHGGRKRGHNSTRVRRRRVPGDLGRPS